MDWLTLLFGIGMALIAGGVAFGGSRAGSAARDAAHRREFDQLWAEVRELRRECNRLAKNGRTSP